MKLVTDAVNPINCDDSTNSADARCAQVRNVNGHHTKPFQVLRPSNNPAELNKIINEKMPLKILQSSNTKMTNRKPLPVLRPNSGSKTGNQFRISRPVHVVKASPVIKPINDAETVHVVNPVTETLKPEEKVYIVEPIAVIKSDGGPPIKVINQATVNKPLEVRRPTSNSPKELIRQAAPVNKPSIQIKRPGESHLQKQVLHKPGPVQPSTIGNRKILSTVKHLDVRHPSDSLLPLIKPVPVNPSAIVKRLGEPLEVRQHDIHNKRSIPLQVGKPSSNIPEVRQPIPVSNPVEVRRPSNFPKPVIHTTHIVHSPTQAARPFNSLTPTSNQPLEVRRPGSHNRIVPSSVPQVIEVRRPGRESVLRVKGSSSNKPIEVRRPSSGTSVLGGSFFVLFSYFS